MPANPRFSFIRPETFYARLEPTMEPLVRALHLLPIQTEWASRGFVPPHPAPTDLLPYPWVVLKLRDPEETERIEAVLVEWNGRHPQNAWMISPDRMHRSFLKEPDPRRMSLVPADENSAQSSVILEDYHWQVRELADVIIGRALWEEEGM